MDILSKTMCIILEPKKTRESYRQESRLTLEKVTS